jgi:hypothetical protein
MKFLNTNISMDNKVTFEKNLSIVNLKNNIDDILDCCNLNFKPTISTIEDIQCSAYQQAVKDICKLLDIDLNVDTPNFTTVMANDCPAGIPAVINVIENNKNIVYGMCTTKYNIKSHNESFSESFYYIQNIVNQAEIINMFSKNNGETTYMIVDISNSHYNMLPNKTKFLIVLVNSYASNVATKAVPVIGINNCYYSLNNNYLTKIFNHIGLEEEKTINELNEYFISVFNFISTVYNDLSGLSTTQMFSINQNNVRFEKFIKFSFGSKTNKKDDFIKELKKQQTNINLTPFDLLKIINNIVVNELPIRIKNNASAFYSKKFDTFLSRMDFSNKSFESICKLFDVNVPDFCF